MESDFESGSDLPPELNFNSDDEPPCPQAGDVAGHLHAGYGDEICVRWLPLASTPVVGTPEKTAELLQLLDGAQPQWTTLGQSASFPQLLSLAARRMCPGEVAIVSGPAAHLRAAQNYLYSPAALAARAEASASSVASAFPPSSYAAFRKSELASKRRTLRALREKNNKEEKGPRKESGSSPGLSLGSVESPQGARLPPASPRPSGAYVPSSSPAAHAVGASSLSRSPLPSLSSASSCPASSSQEGRREKERHHGEANAEGEARSSVVLQLLAIQPIRRLTEDGGVRMRVLRPGTGWRSPGRNDLVSVSLAVLCKDAFCRELQLKQLLRGTKERDSPAGDAEKGRDDSAEHRTPAASQRQHVGREDEQNREGIEETVNSEDRQRVACTAQSVASRVAETQTERFGSVHTPGCSPEGAQQGGCGHEPSPGVSCCKVERRVSGEDGRPSPASPALATTENPEDEQGGTVRCQEVAMADVPIRGLQTALRHMKQGEETLLTLEGEHVQLETLHASALASWTCSCCGLPLADRRRAPVGEGGSEESEGSAATESKCCCMPTQACWCVRAGDPNPERCSEALHVYIKLTNWRPRATICVPSPVDASESLGRFSFTLLTGHAEDRQRVLVGEGQRDAGRAPTVPVNWRPEEGSTGGLWRIDPPPATRRASRHSAGASSSAAPSSSSSSSLSLSGGVLRGLGGSLACAASSAEKLVRANVDEGTLEAVVRCVRQKEVEWGGREGRENTARERENEGERERENEGERERENEGEGERENEGEREREKEADPRDGEQRREEADGSRDSSGDAVRRVEWQGEEAIKKMLDEAVREERRQSQETESTREESEDSRVVVTIWMASILDRSKDLWARGTPDEKIQLVERFRQEGNLLLKRGWLAAASDRYARAFDVCRFLPAFEEATRLQPLLATSQGSSTASTVSAISSSSAPSLLGTGGSSASFVPQKPRGGREAHARQSQSAAGRSALPERLDAHAGVGGETEGELSLAEVTRLATSVLNNWTLCCLRQNLWRAAVRHATVSLLLLELVEKEQGEAGKGQKAKTEEELKEGKKEEKKEKEIFQHARCVALYRKAKALSDGGETDEAIKAAKAAATIEPEDSAIQILLKTLHRQRAHARESERATFLGMFQRASREARTGEAR
ncbi:conserved hypothetical protein [Neospora caninum Liverpool]|uniref:Tetratricopeptide repeat-containing protein n=1 Tax=Neospora caninum (strain Liverpool) TaxID=572307 RepID=F0VJ56_NEOCL|nr:conserved hypothetical protein [Neospora caninum Liverpool]CBZ53767.1 conserved hypothetical protein [Neospora caninum Liverpool]|eukprot:XP_003883799.1 conserved hypothetical protein [Neospora caninum Liverpool]